MAKSKKDSLTGKIKIGGSSLRRSVVTDEATERKVVQQVADNPPAPTPKPTETSNKTAPKPAARSVRSRKKAEAVPGKRKRLTVDISEEMHRKLKVFAYQNGTSIRELVLDLIEKKVR